jgi:hypothetical protein
MSLSKNPIFHACTKHIEIHHHSVQEKNKKSFVKLVYYNTENIVAHILIKGLFVDKHEHFLYLMDMFECIT